jgi:hypothetical protein
MPVEAMIQLADAFEISLETLLAELPPTWDASPDGPRRPQVLDRAECLRLLAGEVVGRIAFATPDGPILLPVNYVLVGDRIVLRTAPDSAIARYARGRVAFEVDHIEPERRRGWSVVIRGTAGRWAASCALPEDVVSPWVGGPHDLITVCIDPTQLTGRRIG